MLKSKLTLAVVVAVLLSLASAIGLLHSSPSAQAEAPLQSDGVKPLLAHSPASAYPIDYFQISPLVVDPNVSETVQLKFTSDGTVTSMKLALATGVTKTLVQVGNVFSTTLTPAQALFGYTASDYNHNIVGRLHVYQGPIDAGAFGVFVNVKDDSIPDVSSSYGGCFILCAYKQSAHVVNLWMPWLDAANPNVISITQQFYRYFGDDYDFLSIVIVPERYANRYHANVQNNVSGIGLPLSDNTAFYGSGGRLLGFTEYPLSTYFDMASQASLHEIGHQWINYLRSNELRGVTPHWPISSLAYGMMGWQDASGEGLEFPWTFTPIGSDRYQLAWADYALTYNSMELYLMGLAPASSVGGFVVANDQSAMPCSGCIVTATIPYKVADVIRDYGARSPAYPSARRKFRVATIVVTQSRDLLSDREMAFFDHMAARGSLMTPLNYSEGFASGVTWPFYLATSRRGCLITTIASDGACYTEFMPLLKR